MKKIKFILTLVIILSSFTAGQFRLPDYEILKMKNGLTVYLMEKKDVPLISISMVFGGGAVKDGKISGLSSFTAEALKFGTAAYSKTQIDSLFNFYGSDLNTYATLDYSGLTTQIMKENFSKLFPVIKEVVLNPTFPADEIEKRKQRWIAELEQAKESPRAVIQSYFNKLIFGNEVYANPLNGTKAGVAAINQKIIKEFYQMNYSPESSVISIVGDFNTSSMKSELEKHFNQWRSSGPQTSEDFTIIQKPFDKARVYLINKENAFETTFLIGGLGITMSNEDQVQIDVINTILGGRFTSWLNDELRVNAGLTYGARSRFASYRFAGTFYISSFTATKNTEAALDLAVKTYNRLFEKGIDDATLRSAKNYVKGQFPPDYETSSALARFLTQKFIYGIDDSYINEFEKKVDQLNVSKANEIINKYFPKENLQFTLIGKSDEIRKIAQKYGELIERNIDDDGF
jgi:predicted Zn-dependent peptidase